MVTAPAYELLVEGVETNRVQWVIATVVTFSSNLIGVIFCLIKYKLGLEKITVALIAAEVTF